MKKTQDELPELIDHIRRETALTEPEGEVRSMKEVALEYFPTNTPRSATRALRREIACHRLLPHLLEQTGWHPSRRYLTPLQCRIIAYYLG